MLSFVWIVATCPLQEACNGYSQRVTDRLNHKVLLLFWFLTELLKLESDKQKKNVHSEHLDTSNFFQFLL